MLASMTGCGIAEGTIQGSTIRVEVRSLNSRYLDYSTRLPSSLMELEPEIKTLVQKRITRGKVTISVSLGSNAGAPAMTLDEKRVSFYIQAIKKIKKKYKLSGDVDVQNLMSLPGIFVSEQALVPQTSLKRSVLSMIDKAVSAMLTEKKKEGAYIVKDMRARVSAIETMLEEVHALAQQEPSRMREKIAQRIQALDDTIKLNPERLEQEVLFWIDKSEVTEEIVRLRSHCVSFKDVLASTGEAGKKLEFMVQEMNREINTIGSKSQHMIIAQRVIAMKLEVEKIREQVQNLE